MTSTESNGTVYLVDAFTLLFQVFYAIRDMNSPKGMPTNALFGFTRDMIFLHQEKKPDYLICVFDVGEPTFRNELFAEYKANRSEMPEELRVQMAAIGELLEAMNVPNLGIDGFEADDIIATVATAADREGMEVFVCTSDKDMRQLITDKVKIYSLRKHAVMDRDALQKDWGIAPEQVVDLQSMVGDSVDNIDGVPGIGVKTAAKLLQEYETLDNVLANVDKISGTKRRENLSASKSIVERNRHLVKLKTDVPVQIDWDAWRRQSFNVPRLLELFREWGFHRFADQVQAESGAALAPATGNDAPPKAATGSLFPDESDDHSAGGPAQATDWNAQYHLVDSAEQLNELLERMSKLKRFAFDLETTSLEHWRAEIVGYAFSWEAGEGWYVPVRGPRESKVLDPVQTLDALRPLFEDPKISKVNQNIKYDALVLRQFGVEVRGIAGDSMVADFLLNAAERSRRIENLSRSYLRHEMIPITELIGKKGPKQKRMDEVPPGKIAEYAGEDADVAWRLCEILERQLDEEKLRNLYDSLEIPLIDVLIELEHNGIRLNVDLLKDLGVQLGKRLADIESAIYEIAGEEFNIGSLKQLRRVMFEKLNMRVVRKTGITGEPSTDQETLEQLASEGEELPKLLLEHRQIAKLKGTYIDTLPELVNPKTQRVHTSFHQTVAATGRLSSSDPNLQNIPIRTELGGQIRQAFIPEKGWILLKADYSQIELRLLAHFSDDPELMRAFQEDRDVHSLVAAQIYGVSEKDVQSDMRRMAKVVNFGVIYGMSPFGLAQRLQIGRKEAETFIETYFARYPQVLTYQQDLLKRCREQGHVSTILGHRRPFQKEAIRANSTYKQRNTAEREAINMQIQGSAADLIKVAMIAIYRRMRKEQVQSRMLLQIHDELVFECPAKELPATAKLVCEEMTSAMSDKLKVPLKVDVSAGPNWLDVEEYSGLG